MHGVVATYTKSPGAASRDSDPPGPNSMRRAPESTWITDS